MPLHLRHIGQDAGLIVLHGNIGQRQHKGNDGDKQQRIHPHITSVHCGGLFVILVFLCGNFLFGRLGGFFRRSQLCLQRIRSRIGLSGDLYGDDHGHHLSFVLFLSRLPGICIAESVGQLCKEALGGVLRLGLHGDGHRDLSLRLLGRCFFLFGHTVSLGQLLKQAVSNDVGLHLGGCFFHDLRFLFLCCGLFLHGLTAQFLDQFCPDRNSLFLGLLRLRYHSHRNRFLMGLFGHGLHLRHQFILLSSNIFIQSSRLSLLLQELQPLGDILPGITAAADLFMDHAVFGGFGRFLHKGTGIAAGGADAVAFRIGCSANVTVEYVHLDSPPGYVNQFGTIISPMGKENNLEY